MSDSLFRKTGKRLLGLAVFAVMFSLAALVVITGPTAQPEEVTEQVRPVSVIRAEPTPRRPLLQAYGRVESRQVARIAARVSATVEEVSVAEGDRVEAGDVLVQLDPAEARLALDSAEAAHRRAQAELESVREEQALAEEQLSHHRELADLAEARLQRHQSLRETSMISAAQLDEIRQQSNERALVLTRHLTTVRDFPNQIARQRAAVEEAAARVEQARLDLRHTRISVPFSGRVLSTGVARGDRVSTGTVLLEVADYGQLELRATLPASATERLRPGPGGEQEVSAMARIGGERQRLPLKRLAADIKEGQSGLDAFFSLPPDPSLVTGTLLSLDVELPREPGVVALPLHALYENNRIYRVEDGRLQALDVTRVGEYRDEQGNYRVLVRSPEIREGDQLMTTQLPSAITGLRVDPRSGERSGDVALLQPAVVPGEP